MSSKKADALLRQQYRDMIEGTYVEPGHDVAPNAWVADGSPTRQRGIMTTDRERYKDADRKLSVDDLRYFVRVDKRPPKDVLDTAADAIESLMRENEALREKAKQVLSNSRRLLNEDQKLVRENAALRALRKQYQIVLERKRAVEGCAAMTTDREREGEVWNNIRDCEELRDARRRLSTHELRTIIHIAQAPFKRENEALRAELEAVRFALNFSPKPDDYGTA